MTHSKVDKELTVGKTRYREVSMTCPVCGGSGTSLSHGGRDAFGTDLPGSDSGFCSRCGGEGLLIGLVKDEN